MKHQKISGIYAGASAFDGQKLTVCGWVRTVRDMKNFGFVELNDGSCLKSLQIVFERSGLNNYDEIARQEQLSGSQELAPRGRVHRHIGHLVDHLQLAQVVLGPARQIA